MSDPFSQEEYDRLKLEHKTLCVVIGEASIYYHCVKHLFSTEHSDYVILYRDLYSMDGRKEMHPVAMLYRPQIAHVLTPTDMDYRKHYKPQ